MTPSAPRLVPYKPYDMSFGLVGLIFFPAKEKATSRHKGSESAIAQPKQALFCAVALLEGNL